MNWYKKSQNQSSCNFQPLNSIKRIDSQSLLDEALNIHFGDDTLGAEESDLPSKINEYYWYDLRLLNIQQLRYVDSVKNAPYQIERHKIEKNKQLIQKSKTYPPIIVDALNNIIDGYHRVFALKELGCINVWVYVPDKKSKNNELV